MHTTLRNGANFRLSFTADSGLGYCKTCWHVFSCAKKQVRVFTADHYTFSTNSFPLDPALYQITSKHFLSSHTAWQTAAKKPWQNWPGRDIWMYWIFYIQIKLWNLNIFHHDALMSLTEEWVNYNQREEIILSSHKFLALFERGWTPIDTDWTQWLKLHLRQHWTECSVRGQKHFYV